MYSKSRKKGSFSTELTGTRDTTLKLRLSTFTSDSRRNDMLNYPHDV